MSDSAPEKPALPRRSTMAITVAEASTNSLGAASVDSSASRRKRAAPTTVVSDSVSDSVNDSIGDSAGDSVSDSEPDVEPTPVKPARLAKKGTMAATVAEASAGKYGVEDGGKRAAATKAGESIKSVAAQGTRTKKAESQSSTPAGTPARISRTTTMAATVAEAAKLGLAADEHKRPAATKAGEVIKAGARVRKRKAKVVEEDEESEEEVEIPIAKPARLAKKGTMAVTVAEAAARKFGVEEGGKRAAATKAGESIKAVTAQGSRAKKVKKNGEEKKTPAKLAKKGTMAATVEDAIKSGFTVGDKGKRSAATKAKQSIKTGAVRRGKVT